MYCPNCKTEMKCPCSNCKSRNKDAIGEYWIWVNGDWIKCSKCGYIKHVDVWQDIDYTQAKQGSDSENCLV